jgi:hypothetical protein
MAAGPQAFYSLWQDENICETLFSVLRNEDVCNVRLASSACCNLVTKRLFLRTHLTFTANTFTRQSRVQALSRIGHHIQHLTFYLPHSDATFLPPLVHPETGREISFLYTPHTSMASVLARPKFANNELGEILTQQYPPLFHAATNVPSFINAMKHLPNMRHLTIRTPGQDPQERYRRDIVDYALISLRISLERAPLEKLEKLSLSSVHPAAFNYLRYVPGFGCSPKAGRRWKQIRKLQISVESWDFYGPSPGLDHLKIIEDYIRDFSECLEKFRFSWLGRKGPCPLSLAADPLFAPPRSSQKLFHEVTSPMSPLPPAPSRKPIVFRRVRHLAMRNATMNAPQVASLVTDHQHCVREFDFQNVVLLNDGSWDDALSPLMNSRSRNGSDHWSRRSIGSIAETDSLYPHTLDEPASPSAAVEALARELYGLDVEDQMDGASQPSQEDVDFDLPSDLESARKASLLPERKRRRIIRRRRRRRDTHDPADEAAEAPEEKRSLWPFSRKKKSKESLRESLKESLKEKPKEEIPDYDLGPSSPPVEPPHAIHYRSPSMLFGEVNSIRTRSSQGPLFGEVDSRASIHSTTSARILFGELERTLSIHSASSQQQAYGQLERSPTIYSASSQRSPTLHSASSQHRVYVGMESSPTMHSPSSQRRLYGELDSSPSLHSASSQRRLFGEIESEPELSFSQSPTDSAACSIDDFFRPSTPIPEVPDYLPPPPPQQQQQYQPQQQQQHMKISAPILNTNPSMPTLLQPTVYSPGDGYGDDGITAVQRDIEAEEAQRMLAEDAEMRTSALRKAKEAVLNKLTEQFGGGKKPPKKGMGGGISHPYGMGNTMGAKFREGLFGRPSSPVEATFDHQSMDVPILFSRR